LESLGDSWLESKQIPVRVSGPRYRFKRLKSHKQVVTDVVRTRRVKELDSSLVPGQVLSCSNGGGFLP
jgi:hypothetical protein